MNSCSTQSARHAELPSIYNIASVHSPFHCSGALNDLNNLCGTISSLQHTAVLLLYPHPLKTSANVTAFCQFIHTVDVGDAMREVEQI